MKCVDCSHLPFQLDLIPWPCCRTVKRRSHVSCLARVKTGESPSISNKRPSWILQISSNIMKRSAVASVGPGKSRLEESMFTDGCPRVPIMEIEV